MRQQKRSKHFIRLWHGLLSAKMKINAFRSLQNFEKNTPQWCGRGSTNQSATNHRVQQIRYRTGNDGDYFAPVIFGSHTCSRSVIHAVTWWRHEMEAFSALLAICAGNSPGTGEFPAQRPVALTFDVFFDLRLNKRLSKQSCGWWFETPLRPLWRHRNDLNSVFRSVRYYQRMYSHNT